MTETILENAIKIKQNKQILKTLFGTCNKNFNFGKENGIGTFRYMEQLEKYNLSY